MEKSFKNPNKIGCVSTSGKPKRVFSKSDYAINFAKLINEKHPNSGTKQVAYKCPDCHKYHLTTKFRRVR